MDVELFKKVLPHQCLGYVYLLGESDQDRKEQKVMEEIVLLEVVAQKYKIEFEEQFKAWFWALERLSENDRAIVSMMGTWLGQVQGFGQPLPSAWLQVEQALIPIKSPASHLVGHTQNLWVELEHLEPTEATQEGPRPEFQSSPEPEKGLAQGPEPGPARGPTLTWPGLA